MRRAAAISLAVLLMFSLGGCIGGDEDSDGAGDRGARSGAPAETSETRTGPENGGEAISTATGSVDGVDAQVEVTRLDRSGDTTLLSFEVSTDEETEVSTDGQIGQRFDDGVAPSGDDGNESSTADGVTLVDSDNRKRYLVARDSSGECVCERDLSSEFLGKGAVTVSATFGAPPADVDAIDVVVPGFGTLRDVPLAD